MVTWSYILFSCVRKDLSKEMMVRAEIQIIETHQSQEDLEEEHFGQMAKAQRLRRIKEVQCG